MTKPLKLFFIALFVAAFGSLVFIKAGGFAFLFGPVVSDVAYSRLSESSVRIDFKTSRSVNARLQYGTSEMYGVETAEGQVGTQHSFVLSGLLPGRDHNFRVVMREGHRGTLSGNYFISSK